MNSFSSPPIGTLVAVSAALADAELDAIERLGDGLRLEPGETTAKSESYGERIAKVAWIDRSASTEPLYLRLEEIVLRINAQYFRYDLTALVKFQYTVYTAADGAHFDWHHDYGAEEGSPWGPRKLTFSLQLSEPASYGGGELQTRAGSETFVAPKARGTMIAFPSFVAHRVTPVTTGIRKALIVWATGPELR